jgi:carbamate kinase
MQNNFTVIAIGGNLITKLGERGTIEQQWAACDQACKHIAHLVKEGYRVVITHGNGPQVGNILLRSELARNQLPTLPLDVCVADSQGAMGYMIQQLLDRELKKINIKKNIVSLVTQVIVSENDPGFKKPTKPIGLFYSKEEADSHKIKDHWDIIEDSGRGYRRVVPSPEPLEIVEIDAINDLLQKGYILIVGGGGGISVTKDKKGMLYGCEAVIDKDRTSSLLANKIDADMLIITTTVERVFLNFGKKNQSVLDEVDLINMKKYVAEGQFNAGSMLPKIEAIITFLENGGKKGIITTPDVLEKAIQKKTGTHIIKNKP